MKAISNTDIRLYVPSLLLLNELFTHLFNGGGRQEDGRESFPLSSSSSSSLVLKLASFLCKAISSGVIPTFVGLLRTQFNKNQSGTRSDFQN